jgi:hypothetical protein
MTKAAPQPGAAFPFASGSAPGRQVQFGPAEEAAGDLGRVVRKPSGHRLFLLQAAGEDLDRRGISCSTAVMRMR